MKITAIKLAECRVPLPRVLRLASTSITTRDYLAVRVETDAGIAGEAVGYTRGTPLFAAVESLARGVIGVDPLMRGAVRELVAERNIPGRAAFTRGTSLLDIACWDILAKHAALPLHVLLGGWRHRAKVTAVAGYYMDVRSIDDIVDEVRKLRDDGFERVKVMLKGDDVAFDLDYLDAVRTRAPGSCAADAHWSWTSLTDAWRLCRHVDEFGLDFLEDPFAAADHSLTCELQRRMTTPIAAGEDVAETRALKQLAEAIGLLRVDATTCGGITGAVEAVHHASASGRHVLPHAWAPLHVHLACAFPCVEGVEFIPESSGADPLAAMLRNPPRIEQGEMRVPDEPGIGFLLDWHAIEKLAVHHTTV